MEARLPRETRKPFRMANPADSRLISAHNVRQSPVRANGRRGKPRLYGRIYVVSLNHNYGVDVIGHHHTPVDDHVRVVARPAFISASAMRPASESIICPSTPCPREHFLFLVQTVTKYQPRE